MPVFLVTARYSTEVAMYVRAEDDEAAKKWVESVWPERFNDFAVSREKAEVTHVEPGNYAIEDFDADG